MLIDKVGEVQADLGLAVDGDADRMVAVAPSGDIIWPDRLMILFAQQILEHVHREGTLCLTSSAPDLYRWRLKNLAVIQSCGKPVIR